MVNPNLNLPSDSCHMERKYAILFEKIGLYKFISPKEHQSRSLCASAPREKRFTRAFLTLAPPHTHLSPYSLTLTSNPPHSDLFALLFLLLQAVPHPLHPNSMFVDQPPTQICSIQRHRQRGTTEQDLMSIWSIIFIGAIAHHKPIVDST
jgi:hypothetical protein